MNDDAAPIRDTLSETLPILKTYLGVEEAENLKAFIEKRLAEGKPTVMVYGIYNSGKSTLLNALRGQNLAPVANRPETDKVVAYEWDGFDILDTPGIDAPQEHETVTRRQLENVDVILFVMDSSSTFEERKVYDEIVNLMAKGKRLMIIVNCKSGLTKGDGLRFRIHDKILENIQSAMSRRSLDLDEHTVWIRMVDAKTGLRGRIENKPKLIKASLLAELERDMKIILGEAGFHDIVNTVGERLLKTLERAVSKATPDKTNNGLAHRMAEYEVNLNKEKVRVENILSMARQNAVSRFSRKLKNVLDSGQLENALDSGQMKEDLVKAIYEAFGPIEEFNDAIGRELEAARRKFPELVPLWRETAGQREAFAQVLESAPLDFESGNSDSGGEIGGQALFFLRDLIIGFGKINPFVAAGMEMLPHLYQYFLEKKREKQSAEAKQRDMQQWDDFVLQSAMRLNEFLGREVQQIVDEAFRKAEDSVRVQRRGLEDQARVKARDREVLSGHYKYIRRHLDYMRGIDSAF